MGLFSSIFGEDKPRIDQVSSLTPDQRPVSKELGKASLAGLAQPPLPMSEAGISVLERVLSGIPSGFDLVTPEATEDYIKSNIADKRRFDWRKHGVPAIEKSFAGPGFTGSARMNRLSQGWEDLESEIARLSDQQRLNDRNLRINLLSQGDEAARLALPFEHGYRKETGATVDQQAFQNALNFMGVQSQHTLVTPPMQSSLGALGGLAGQFIPGMGGGSGGSGTMGSLNAALSGGLSGGLGGGLGGQNPSGIPQSQDSFLNMNSNDGSGIFGNSDWSTGNQYADTGINMLPMLAAMFCWVAEEIWGVNHQKVWAARAWCVFSGESWFTRLYQRHGMKWAAMVRKYPALRIITRPIWSLMAMHGRQALNRWRKTHGVNAG